MDILFWHQTDSCFVWRSNTFYRCKNGQETRGSNPGAFHCIGSLFVNTRISSPISLFTPNAIEYFLWSLAIYLIFRMAETENPRVDLDWNCAWTFIQHQILSRISDYQIFYGNADFKTTKAAFSWWFTAGIVAGLLLILPNIIWQYNHNWPVFNHFKELKETQISNLKLRFTRSN